MASAAVSWRGGSLGPRHDAALQGWSCARRPGSCPGPLRRRASIQRRLMLLELPAVEIASHAAPVHRDQSSARSDGAGGAQAHQDQSVDVSEGCRATGLFTGPMGQTKSCRQSKLKDLSTFLASGPGFVHCSLGAVVVSVLVAYRSRPIPPDPGATGDAVGGVPTAVTASLHAQT